MGLTTLKFFPAEASGETIRLITLPLYRDWRSCTPYQSKDYLAIPRVLACGGTWMVDKKLIEEGTGEELAHLTREAVKLVN